jgi:hypothetical protein
MLSHWSESLSFQFGVPPRRILPSILSDVKQNDFIGYARNPGITSSLEGYEPLPLLVATKDPSGGGSRGKVIVSLYTFKHQNTMEFIQFSVHN